MRVFIGVASGAQQHVGSLNSCYEMNRQPGDDLSIQYKARGDVARETLVDHLLEHPEYDALLLLDGDQRHPADLLDKLRASMEAGDLDMVCAHYYKRDTRLIQSLCYAYGDGTYPFLPLLDPPREGLHRLAWTGFGCVLIHRRVIEAVKATLPRGANPVATGPLPEVTGGDYDNFGPDARFFIRALRLGFKLWLRADVESLHATTLWLGHKGAALLQHYGRWADAAHPLLEERVRLHGMTPEAYRQRLKELEARKKGLAVDLEAALGADQMDQAQALSAALYEMDGRLKECGAWLKLAEDYPPIVTPADLPTTANSPLQPPVVESAADREQVYQGNAAELVSMLPPAALALGRDGQGVEP
jgi:hypothetical protein